MVHSEFKLQGKQINTINGYFTETMNGLFVYLKDGKLHRDLGPAIMWENEKDKYFFLGDENLYIPSNHEVFKNYYGHYLTLTLFDMNLAGKLYYLNGIHHSEEEFNAILEKKKLNAELEQNLFIANNNQKKIKI
jgi:hypothetical protein